MKTSVSKIKLIALGLVSLFSTATTFAANNNDVKNPEEVRFVGNVNEQPVYRLSLNNNKAATYLISIKDDDGNTLYKEKISGASIVRNYQLEEVPSFDYSLTFEVSNIEENKSSIYIISKTKKVLDEVEVSKIK